MILTLKRFFLFFLFLYAQTCLYSQEISGQVLELWSQKKYKQAIKQLDKVEKAGNANHLTYYYRGMCHEMINEAQKAYDDYSMAIIAKADFAPAYFQRGTLILVPKLASESINDFNMAIKHAKVDSIRLQAYANRASAKMMLGNVDASIKDCLEVTTKDSTSKYGVAALVTLANCYDSQKKYDASERILKKLYLRDSSDMAIISNLGFTLSKVDRHQEAIYYFDRALKLFPNAAYPLSNKSYSLMKLGRLQEALTNIRLSIQADPENSYAYKNLGEILLALELKGEACEAFRMAINKGFTDMYGNEVNELMAKHCKK